MGEARARQEDASLLKPQVCLGNPIMAPSSLIPKSAAVRSGNEFGWVPSFWNSLCTQWELNKYLMMVLNLGSQQLFPALTLRTPWDRSGGERPRGLSVFLPDLPMTPSPAGAIVHFTHPALGRPVLPPQLLSGSFHPSFEQYLWSNHCALSITVDRHPGRWYRSCGVRLS